MKTKGIYASSMILAGSVLGSFYNVGRGWTAALIALIGFTFLIVGLVNFKKELDQKGSNALNLVFIAAIIAAVGALIALVPFAGFIARLLLIAAFIIKLIGYLQLKSSETIGEEGKSGANLLTISMILLLAGFVFRFIPAIGGVFATIFALLGLFFMVFGWIGVQKGYVGHTQVNAVSVSYILAGMLIQVGATAMSGWGAAIASLFGFIVFFTGLNKLKNTMDAKGQEAVQMLILAVFIGLGASVLDFIASLTVTRDIYTLGAGMMAGSFAPSIFERVVSFIFIAAFVLQLIGYVKIKDSELIDATGRTGSTLLIIAAALAIVASIFSGMFIIGGGFVAGIFGIGSLFLVLFGWLGIQKSIATKSSVEA